MEDWDHQTLPSATARNENPVHPSVANVIDFLTHLYDTAAVTQQLILLGLHYLQQ